MHWINMEKLSKVKVFSLVVTSLPCAKLSSWEGKVRVGGWGVGGAISVPVAGC